MSGHYQHCRSIAFWLGTRAPCPDQGADHSVQQAAHTAILWRGRFALAYYCVDTSYTASHHPWVIVVEALTCHHAPMTSCCKCHHRTELHRQLPTSKQLHACSLWSARLLRSASAPVQGLSISHRRGRPGLPRSAVPGGSGRWAPRHCGQGRSRAEQSAPPDRAPGRRCRHPQGGLGWAGLLRAQLLHPGARLGMQHPS